MIACTSLTRRSQRYFSTRLDEQILNYDGDSPVSYDVGPKICRLGPHDLAVTES